MDTRLVTIVTPSYNQGQFIRTTIESVLRQDYPHIEYIIMDGGSTDETAAVVKDYASKVTFISEKDSGQSHAINKGFRMAKGEVVAWLNSDDLILDGAVERAARAFSACPEAGAIYGEGYQIDRGGNVTTRFRYTEPFNLWKLVHLSDYILQQTTYFRRSVLHEVGYLDESLHYALDWDLLIRIGKRYQLCYIPEYMGCLREYPEAKSFAGGVERIREIARVLRRHTGQRMPPGLIVYGLDTYRNIWCGKIEQHTPSFLRRPSRKLQRVLFTLAGRYIEHTIREAQGWYSDGWASRRLRYMLPPGSGTIVIQGALPAKNARLQGQTLDIFCNASRVARFALPFGDFHLELPVKTLCGDSPIELELQASRYFTASVPDEPRPRRRLAYVLKSVAWRYAPAAVV
jgi:glycosyltransferase involved in cell wall biosynthesis